MKHIIFLLLLLLFSCKKSENRKEEIIPKDETLDLKYEVLNQLINEIEAKEKFTDTYVYNISVKPISLEIPMDTNEPPPPPPGFGISLNYDSIFISKDSAYYRNENQVFKNFKFDKNKIRKHLQYTTDEELFKLNENKESDYWTEFDKKYGNKCIQRFSVPFFNKDKTMCVVQNSTSCGYLNGRGYTAIYKKVDGKWIEVKSFDHWIS